MAKPTEREKIGERIAYELEWPKGSTIMRCGGTISIKLPSGNEYEITVSDPVTRVTRG